MSKLDEIIDKYTLPEADDFGVNYKLKGEPFADALIQAVKEEITFKNPKLISEHRHAIDLAYAKLKGESK